MKIIKRIGKAVLIWFVLTIVLCLIFSTIYPTGTEMPLFFSFFILILPIYCSAKFSKERTERESEQHPVAPSLQKPIKSPLGATYSTQTVAGEKDCGIIVYRQKQLQSYGKPYKVFLDGTPSGTLLSGKTVSIVTTPGEHRMEFKGYFRTEACIDFVIPESQRITTIFTRISLKNGKIIVDEISEGKSFSNSQEKSVSPSTSTSRPSSRANIMSSIDSMEGHAFEEFVADLLRKLGYERVKVTPGSGDQGVDVIASKDGKKYAIQCKRYSQKLGNKPVQEAHAGKTIYGCSVAVVITNNYFTEGGKEAAQALGVELWDRDTLQRMLTYAEHMSMRTVAQ